MGSSGSFARWEKPSIVATALPPPQPAGRLPRRCSVVVIDTNVVLDWLVFRDARIAPALDAAIVRRTACWVACPPMRDELIEVLRRGLAQRAGVSIDAAVQRWDAGACMRRVPPSDARWRCRDPDDQVFVDLALAAAAHWLLTHDRALLALARSVRPCGLRIATPAEWIAAAAGDRP